MIKKQDGFTLVELMITMVIFVIAIAAASNIFTAILTQFKQQSKIAETNIEGVVGFETLRYDVEQAGYGLPWDMNGATYANEAAAVAYDGTFPLIMANAYNDAANGIPRAFVSGDNVLMNGSDVLVIKATNASTAAAAQKWTYISNSGALPNTLRTWGTTDEVLLNTDSIIVIKPVIVDRQRVLINNAGAFSIPFIDLPTVPGGGSNANFEPLADTYDTYIIYGIDNAAARMPFNRTDYYVKKPAGNAMPSQCAQNTGVLYKATINHSNGGLNELPIIDCVADMQVVFGLDQNENGTVNCYTNNLLTGIVKTGGANSQNIRNEAKEVRVYILAHEGQRDVNFTFNNFSPAAPFIRVGEALTVCEGGIAGQDFNLSAVTNYLNYRWKLYTLVVTPNNLR
jgi:prepilin-type N-terminal cleavage/methylation domain-containing protein